MANTLRGIGCKDTQQRSRVQEFAQKPAERQEHWDPLADVRELAVSLLQALDQRISPGGADSAAGRGERRVA